MRPPAARLLMICALVSGALGCSRDRDRAGQPVVVIPDEPARPLARRPPAQESRPSGERAPQPSLEHVSGDGYEGWIRPASSATGSDAWQPTAEQIAAAETALRDAAPEAVARGDWPQDLDLASYARQYRGYRAGGVAILRIDLYCAASRHLASRLVSVSRGGTCFLHTAYEVESGRFRYFASNPR